MNKMLDGLIDGWMDGWMHGWMNAWLDQCGLMLQNWSLSDVILELKYL